MNICIIPARGGSKRIPQKNIKNFHGHPIISYSIQSAIKSNLFDEVMVSTDDPEIAEISIKYGASVPFLRSAANSDDYSGTGDALNEVLKKYEEVGKYFSVACCLYPTAPFVTEDRIKQAFAELQISTFDVIFPVAKFRPTIFRSYRMLADSSVAMNFPEYEISRSQDLPDAYYDAGQFYFFRTQNFFKLKNKNTFGLSKGVIVLDDSEVQDIDSPEDWQMAEMKYLVNIGAVSYE
ncbi:pseudaminic acid cytidylyltransferase [Polynucleobacter alcilacus]|uniref:pseudaminic acid cytidylyltransferase n=1 Tax=Polynucleobacter alcilacus TaxID=1819739 RepID=UPI001C0DC150|nr:pseudaminic acid cytidylyltransferase [Polynucleobacter alcilacus]MBU3568170.1 pseudaminic acid cytidylyltransferase [Polynucleobacter alcilacus]